MMAINVSNNGFFTRMVCILFLLFLPAGALAHDVDGNGQEGLAEAIHALQVVAGMTPDTSSPIGDAQPGQVLSGYTFSNDNETGLVGEYAPRTGNAQPSQVAYGVTFSNENEAGLVGEYHGPPGCFVNGYWDEVQCWNDCVTAYGYGSTEFNSCYHDWCMEVKYNWELQLWIQQNICSQGQ